MRLSVTPVMLTTCLFTGTLAQAQEGPTKPAPVPGTAYFAGYHSTRWDTYDWVGKPDQTRIKPGDSVKAAESVKPPEASKPGESVKLNDGGKLIDVTLLPATGKTTPVGQDRKEPSPLASSVRWGTKDGNPPMLTIPEKGPAPRESVISANAKLPPLPPRVIERVTAVQPAEEKEETPPKVMLGKPRPKTK